MPHLSVAEVRISLLFEENARFCAGTINSSFLAAFSPSVSSSFELRLPELSQNFTMSKTPYENCCVQQSVEPPFFEFLQKSMVGALH